MTREQIENLMAQLPANNAFVDPNLPAKDQQAAWTAPARRAICLRDPAFTWKYVRTFVEARKPLPNSAGKGVLPIMARAYDHLTGKSLDRDIEVAESLTHPYSTALRSVVEAGLLCLDPSSRTKLLRRPTNKCDGATNSIRLERLPYSTIADAVSLSAQTISDFHDLFFDVRNRLHETPYIVSIVYPNGLGETKTAAFRQFGSPRQKLLVAAREHGFERVLALAGYDPESLSDPTLAEASRRLRVNVLMHANDEVAYGDSSSQLIAQAAKFAAIDDSPTGEKPDSVMGLTAMSLRYPIAEEIRKMQQPDIDVMLQMQRELAPSKDSQVKAYDDKEAAA